jgi:hypothetical protein
MTAIFLVSLCLGCGKSDDKSALKESPAHEKHEPSEAKETMSLIPRTEELVGYEKTSSNRIIEADQLEDFLGSEFDLFRKYHVQHAVTADFRATDSDLQYSLEVMKFEHGSYAFGAYSMLRHPDLDFLPIGTQGFIDGSSLTFYSSDYVIRVRGYQRSAESDSGAVTLARVVEKKLGDSPGLPMAIQLMPEDGRVENTEKYIPSRFLDVKFFSPAYTCEYELPDTTMTLFFIPRGATAEIHQYEEFLSARSGRVVKATMDDILIFMCDDDRFGRVIMTSRSGRLAGVLRTPNRDIGLGLLKKLWDRVAEYENRVS